MYPPKFDVVVVGAGPAGASAAIELAQRGFAVAVLAGTNSSAFKIGESVPADIERYLQALGVWKHFTADGHLAALASSSAWGTPDLVTRDTFTNTTGSGWKLDRSIFDARLIEQAEIRGAIIKREWRLTHLEKPNAGPLLLTVKDTQRRCHSLTSEFIVDATGRRAKVSRMCGGTRLRIDHQVAAYATFPSCSSINVDLVETEEMGWWYISELPRQRTLACLFSDSDLLRTSKRHHVSDWFCSLKNTRYAARRLGPTFNPEEFRVCDASTQCVRPLIGSRWLAVGDAAASWDPLTSGGIIQALRSGIKAAKAIEERFAGNTQALIEYEREILDVFTTYIKSRRNYYESERQWPESPFWSRRLLWK